MSARVLLHLDTGPQPSTFDALVAYDAGVERVLSYGSVRPAHVRDLVYGAVFARSEEALSQTAVFCGGSQLHLAEEILAAVQATFVGEWRVSAMLDAGGCNTTAAAVTARLAAAAGLAGQRVMVLAGTGPVGQRAAGLLALAGADVTLSSRRQATAEEACRAIQARFGAVVRPAEVTSLDACRRILKGADAVVATGPPGVRLLPAAIWQETPGLRLLVDTNAVPPPGIEGMDMGWDGEERDGRLFFGALGIGRLKMELHRACLSCLFASNDRVLDAREIMVFASEVVGRCAS